MNASSVSLMILVVLITQLVCGPAILTGNYITEGEGLDSMGPGVTAYEESGPIEISGNDDFAAQAILNGWSGDGAPGTPFIIANLNISLASGTVPLVNITDTSLYFQLEDCLLVGGLVGLYFDNVSFGSVIDTAIEGCVEQGVLAMGSSELSFLRIEIGDIDGQGVNFNQVNDSIIQNTIIEECGDRGVLIDYSFDCVVGSSEITKCSNGAAAFRDSQHCTLYNNTVILNSGDAMTLGNAWYCDIIENTVVNCTGAGMSIQSSANATIFGNVICNATGEAVSVQDSEYCLVCNNTFYRNEFHAVRLSSDNGQVCGNNFVDNMLTSPPAGECSNQGSNNQFDFNFWSRWLTPDDNGDGYVDAAYEVGGGAYDEHPRTRVYLTDRIHLVTRPILLTPDDSISGQRVWGEIGVEWALCSDTFGHDITYSLYYTPDDGQSWTEVVSGLTQTQYDWNSSTVTQGLEYRLAVAARCSAGLESSDSPALFFEVLQHTLIGLAVTYPNGGEVISSAITVTWNPAVDSYGHDIVYAVYISPDGGITWIQLGNVTNADHMVVSGPSVETGSDYVLKIVARCSEGLEIEDVSDASFTISDWVQSYGPWLIVSVAAAVILVPVVFLKRR